ncbi:sytalpha [Biomphalaria glabrata]
MDVNHTIINVLFLVSFPDLSSEAATPASIPHPRDLTFTFPGGERSGTSGGSSDGQPSTPPSGYNPGRRRASMHDAIDLSKIDTRLYDKKVSVQSVSSQCPVSVQSVSSQCPVSVQSVSSQCPFRLYSRPSNSEF